MKINSDGVQNAGRAGAAQKLISLLTPLAASPNCAEASFEPSSAASLPASRCKAILSAIRALTPTLVPDHPVFATFHDGHVHDPLGGGSYAFQDGIVEPILLALKNDETMSPQGLWPEQPTLLTRPVVIHAGAQPNNSPHAGTLVVFCYAFLLARGICDRMQQAEVDSAGGNRLRPAVSVNVTYVDTSPVKAQGRQVEGIQYQRSHRVVDGALDTYMADYHDVLCLLSTWSGVPFTTAFQADFFSQPSAPALVQYVVSHRGILGRQLSPKFGSLALRAACPVEGCGLAEKHGRLNAYDDVQRKITFRCPDHGPHTICTSDPAEVARLEANAPTRNLIRSMGHLLDDSTHHVRITGADYAGAYQEMLLYRPLAAWSAATGLAAGRTPHILYAPLVVDWSGAKLSKSLYVREGGYEAMKLLGTDGLCSYAQLKVRFGGDGGDGAEGLRRIWDAVQGWFADPRKLFRAFSVDYLNEVIMGTTRDDDEKSTGPV